MSNNPYNARLNNRPNPEPRSNRYQDYYTANGIPRPNFSTPPGKTRTVNKVSINRPDNSSYAGDASTGNFNVNPYVKDIYYMYTEGKIDAGTAGSCITGKIRSLFITGIEKGNDTFDIESLKYFDNILFNDMKYLISSAFFYGSDDRLMRIITDNIDNVCATVDYKLSDEMNGEIRDILISISTYTTR